MDQQSGQGDQDDSTTRNMLLLVVGLLLVPVLLITLLVAVVLAPLALMADGVGDGGVGCSAMTPSATTSAATTAIPAPGSPTPSDDCINPDGNAIVSVALRMAAHLYGNPDVWYDSGFPPEVLAYWQQTCPGCKEW